MSSTNRGSKRNESDWYVTPPWTVHRFLDEMQLHYPSEPTKDWENLPGGRWLEPCAGDGELIRTVNTRRSDVPWSAGELRTETESLLRPLVEGRLYLGDFIEMPVDFFGEKFDVAITNPPFRLALPIIKKCMLVSKMTIMLLRLNFWGSDDRQAFMEQCPPHTYVLPNRPMFSLNQFGKPGTDSPEYAWMVWYDPEYYANTVISHGDIKVLKRTPAAERKLWTEHLKALGPRKVPEPEAGSEAVLAAAP